MIPDQGYEMAYSEGCDSDVTRRKAEEGTQGGHVASRRITTTMSIRLDRKYNEYAVYSILYGRAASMIYVPIAPFLSDP